MSEQAPNIAGLPPQPSCFSCDSQGGGYYRLHPVRSHWYIGHWDGQGHYACEDCKGLLFDAGYLPEYDQFQLFVPVQSRYSRAPAHTF